MSDDNNPFDDMVNAAQKMAQALNPSLASLSSKEFEAFIPQMPKELMELTFGNASNKDGLSAKSRLLLTLAGLTRQGVQAEAPPKGTERIGRVIVFMLSSRRHRLCAVLFVWGCVSSVLGVGMTIKKQVSGG